jgi:hypothetical protein
MQTNQKNYCWSWRWDSNPQPADYKSAALPVELRQHLLFISTEVQTKVLRFVQKSEVPFIDYLSKGVKFFFKI